MTICINCELPSTTKELLAYGNRCESCFSDHQGDLGFTYPLSNYDTHTFGPYSDRHRYGQTFFDEYEREILNALQLV